MNLGENEVRLIETESRSKSNMKRLNALEDKVENLHELTLAISQVSSEVKGIRTDMEEVKEEVKRVTGRPGQWWDKLVAAGLGALASGIVAAVLANVIK